LFGAIILFGVSLGLLLRSPFRMPIGERMFRIVWLGPIGRTFIYAAGRGVARANSGSSASAIVAAKSVNRPATPASKPTGARAPDRVDALEMRVAELERWRRDS
jgi:hypothetical protein